MRAANTARTGNWLDGLALSLSAACAIHCLALPLLIAALPATAQWLDLPESVHLWLLLAAVPISGSVLWSAARRHRSARRNLLLGLSGLAAMSLALMLPSERAETVATLVGAGLLAIAHLRNWTRRAHRHS